MSNLFADRDIYDVISFLTGVIGFAMAVTPFFLRWRKRALAQDDALFEVTKRFQVYRDARAVEIAGLNDRLNAAAARLDLIDPERFIDQTDALARAGNYKDLDRTALEFFHAQGEALTRSVEILTEQRILDSETFGAAAAAEAQRFATIGTAISPDAPRLKELLALSNRRAEGIAKGEPIEALAMDGLSDVELNGLAIALDRKGNYALAEIAARRSVPMAMARTGETSANAANALSVHSVTLGRIGAYAEAEAVARHALEIGRAMFGEADPAFAAHLNNLAGAVRKQGRHAEAEGLYRQVLEIDRATIGEARPEFADHLNNLAGVVDVQGRSAEAEGLYRQALDIDRATKGEAHPAYATRLNNFAGVVRALGRHAEAERLYVQALSISRKALGDSHPYTRSCAENFLNLLTTHLPNSPHLPEVQAVLTAGQPTPQSLTNS